MSLKNVLAVMLLVTTLFTLAYATSVTGKISNRGYQCTCLYTNGQYGVLVPENPQNTAYDCVVTPCWNPIDL